MIDSHHTNPTCPAKLTPARACPFRRRGSPTARHVPEVGNRMSADLPGPQRKGPPKNKSSAGLGDDAAPALGDTQFFTVAEVAKVMRVSKMTVYRLVHSGDLPAVRVGRSFRVRAEAVHSYLETAYFDAG